MRILRSYQRPKISYFYFRITNRFEKTSKVLIVIDIFKGGGTLHASYEFLKQHFLEKNIRVATLFCQKSNKKKIDFCVVRTNKEVTAGGQ